MSRDMKWASYASIQTTQRARRNGAAQIVRRQQLHVGDDVIPDDHGDGTCQGVAGDAAADPRSRADSESAGAAFQGAAKVLMPRLRPQYATAAADYYPSIGEGGRFPTQCNAEDCSATPVRCSAGNTANCMVTVLDHYTTSFNWAAFNFAAIWLRPSGIWSPTASSPIRSRRA